MNDISAVLIFPFSVCSNKQPLQDFLIIGWDQIWCPLHFYHLQRSCSKVMFSQASVILSTGEMSARHTPPGRHPLGRHLPPRQTHPQGRNLPGKTSPPPPSRQTPQGRNPLGKHPQADTPGQNPPSPSRPATAADGTYPTGMHSCLLYFSHNI